MFNKEIPALSFPPPVPPPNLYPPMDFDDAVNQNEANWEGLYKTMKAYEQWLYALASNVYRYAENTNKIMNGQIEFATPDATEHTGNIKVSFVQLAVAMGGTAPNVPDVGPFPVRHGYGDGTKGQAPRGFIQMRNSEAANGNARVIDSILSSKENVTYAATPGPTSVTTTSATLLTAQGFTSADIWTKNRVQVGDEIKLATPAVLSVTGANAAGGTVVTLSGTPTFYPLVGQYLRFNGSGDDDAWHLVEAVDKGTNKITVYPNYAAAHSGKTLYAYMADLSWKKIKAITAGDHTLTLDSPGTDLPVGFSSVDYVIRRPADETYAWVRYFGANLTETTLMFY